MKKLQQLFLTLISGFAVYVFDKIWGEKINWQAVGDIPLLDLLNYKLAVYQVILFGLFFLISYLILRLVKKKSTSRDTIYSRKEERLRKYNTDEIGGMLWKWDVFFDAGGNPHVKNLHPYCMKHGETPIKMASDGLSNNLMCKMPDCDQYIPTSDYYSPNYTSILQYVQSHVEKQWEKLN